MRTLPWSSIFHKSENLKRGWFSFMSLRLLLKAITPSGNSYMGWYERDQEQFGAVGC